MFYLHLRDNYSDNFEKIVVTWKVKREYKRNYNL